MASFETLPTDLRLVILLQLQSPADVFALICASKPYHQVFKSYRSSILYSSLLHAVPKNAFGDMILACKAGEIPRLITRDPSYMTARRNEFLDQNHLADEFCIPARAEDLPISLTCLCRLWRLVDYFVQDYAHVAFAKLSSYSKLIAEKNGSPLIDCNYFMSDEERGRVQRGFFRFELYRRLFGLHDRGERTLRCSGRWRTMHTEFFDEFFPWEKCELRSIRAYLHLKWKQEMIYTVEDDLVSRLNKATSGESPQTWPFPLEAIQFSLLHDQSHLQYQLVEQMIEHGLPFLRTILKLSPPDRLSIATIFPRVQNHLYLQRAMIKDPRDGGPILADFKPDAFQNHVRSPGSGWKWFHWESGRSEENRAYKLEETGFMFWDRTRLEKTGLFDVPLPHPPRPQIDQERLDRPTLRDRAFLTKLGDREFSKLEQETRIDDVDVTTWLARLEY